MQVFSESEEGLPLHSKLVFSFLYLLESGDIAFEGRVSEKGDLQPVINDSYRGMCTKRLQISEKR